MVTAERNTIVSIRRPAMLPGNDVVNICPARWPIAARKGATAVPQDNGDASRSGVWPTAAANVDRHATSVQHHGQDLGGTGQSSRRGRRQALSGVQLADRYATPEGVEVDGHIELRWLTAVVGQAARRERESAHIDQRVGTACRRRTQIRTIVAANGFCQRFDGRADDRGALRIEDSPDAGAAEPIRREREAPALSS